MVIKAKALPATLTMLTLLTCKVHPLPPEHLSHLTWSIKGDISWVPASHFFPLCALLICFICSLVASLLPTLMSNMRSRAGQALAVSATSWILSSRKHQTSNDNMPAQLMVSPCIHPHQALSPAADFRLRPSWFLKFLLKELDPLHCLLRHFTNTTNSNLRAEKKHCSCCQKSQIASFPHFGSIQPPLIQASSWRPPSFLTSCGSGCLQGFCEVPASYSWGSYLRLIAWKFLKYQVVLNHTVLPQENCFTYIKYIRVSKSILLQNLFISKCHLLLGGFFHEINVDMLQRSYLLLYWYFSMTPNFEEESHAETVLPRRLGVKFKCSVIK